MEEGEGGGGGVIISSECDYERISRGRDVECSVNREVEVTRRGVGRRREDGE